MSTASKIEWTETTWNPVTGCDRVSPGCANCYALKMAKRLKAMGNPRYQKDGGPASGPGFGVTMHHDLLTEPLRWRKPRLVFVNSMSDLFHEEIPDDFLDQVFAVMALTPQHTYQVLTKRPERMRDYVSDPDTPFRVAQAMDAITVAREIAALGPEEKRPIAGYPGYYVTNYGRVLSSNGSATCLFCGGAVAGLASKAYCSKKCKHNAQFYRRTGREREGDRTLTAMKSMPGDEGHSRVMLYVKGESSRELIHRLVLTAFVRSPGPGEQGCHRDGDATNNALPNLRWGTQADNWRDRKRHGNAHSNGERRGVPPPISWPLANCWKGVSAESQRFLDERVPVLLDTPAAGRFVSCEPLLGPIDIEPYVELRVISDDDGFGVSTNHYAPRLDWVIVGGESAGPENRALVEKCDQHWHHGGMGGGAHRRDCRGWRPKPEARDWVRSICDQCHAAGVPFFFKQWGGPRPKSAGRTLDGREWSEMPMGR